MGFYQNAVAKMLGIAKGSNGGDNNENVSKRGKSSGWGKGGSSQKSDTKSTKSSKGGGPSPAVKGSPSKKGGKK